MFKKIGPGVLVAAAFIGPGTVTVCTMAGVKFDYSLLWAMLFSIFITVVLQEMAARMGLVTKKGLATVIKDQLEHAWLKKVVIAIILAAILIGNAAYEAGNIGGGTLGLEALFGKTYGDVYAFIIGILAFLLLWIGSYRVLEKIFVAMVMLMSLSFLITAVLVTPNILTLLKGLFVPQVPSESILTIIALVGTTVVPYNLFLHAALVNQKWIGTENLKSVRRDTIVSIALGGVVSMAIIVVGAAIPPQEINTVIDLAKGLEPLYGVSARYFLGIGLFAAGVTSAITAPLAAAFVAQNCFGWGSDMRDLRFRLVWVLVLLVGVVSLYFEFRPIEIIRFAQIANGMLLPIIAILLVWIANKISVLGTFANSRAQRFMGLAIIVFALFLGTTGILKVFGTF